MPEVQTPTKSDDAKPWQIFLIAVAVIAVGLGFGYYTLSNNIRAANLEEHGVKVSGILDNKTRSSSSGNYTYHYELKYDWEGQELTYETSSKFESYGVGDKVELLVNPNNPEEVVINDPSDMGKGSFSWSLIILAVGGGIFWLGLKKVKQK